MDEGFEIRNEFGCYQSVRNWTSGSSCEVRMEKNLGGGRSKETDSPSWGSKQLLWLAQTLFPNPIQYSQIHPSGLSLYHSWVGQNGTKVCSSVYFYFIWPTHVDNICSLLHPLGFMPWWQMGSFYPGAELTIRSRHASLLPYWQGNLIKVELALSVGHHLG